jgi:hypothetical protein
MKKIMLNILFALITTLGYSQVPNYVPTNGLVGWWPFNGNANDESGNGNNGTVNGATLTSDRFGNINQAYGFDGNDWIEMNIPQTIEFSVSVWFNSSILNQSYMGIVQHKDNCIRGAGYIVELYNNSIRELASNCGQCNNICPNYCQFNVPFSVGKHHDGAQDLYYFNGDIDDIGSWNRPISDCEIQDLYHSQLGFTTIDAGPNQTICKDDSVTLNGSGGIFLSWNNGVIDAFPFAPLQTDSYVLTGADTLGCVGTDTVNITVLNPTTSTQTQTALDTYTWPLNNQTYTQGGTYTATIPNAAGCDSVVTLNLTFNYTGINEPIGSAVSISPNPTRSKITVKSSLTLIGEKFTIYDQQGKAVKMGVITAEETEIDLSNLSEGVYLFKAGTEMQETFKIIKQ